MPAARRAVARRPDAQSGGNPRRRRSHGDQQTHGQRGPRLGAVGASLERIAAPAPEPHARPHDEPSSGATGSALPSRGHAARRPTADFERHPLIAVLTTPHDTRADWLRAGQALEHALLVATSHGVKASMFSQAIEWPDLRWALRDPRDGYGYVQMLARFDYGPKGPATAPRRQGCPGQGRRKWHQPRARPWVTLDVQPEEATAGE